MAQDENGKLITITIDIKFIDGEPAAILEYSAAGDDELMSLYGLDSEKVKKISSPGFDYAYEGLLVLPRVKNN